MDLVPLACEDAALRNEVDLVPLACEDAALDAGLQLFFYMNLLKRAGFLMT